MRHVEAGGLRVSAVGLGTWQFGSREWGYGDAYASGEAARIVGRALDLGVTLFDTAEVYGRGRSERILADALGARRSEVVVASKWAPVVPTAAQVRRHVEGSLGRLRTDRIDLYQVHWPNPASPAGGWAGELAALQREGRVGHLGVSNHSLARWKAVEAAAGVPVIANQVEYHLADRRPEAELLPWAQANGRLVIAYSPLAQGAFSGRWTPGQRPGGLRRVRPLFAPANMRRAAELVATLERVADAHGATPSQVQLAWLLRRPNVVVIPGASSVGQLEANVAAADLELSEDDDAAVADAASRFHPVTGLGAAPAIVAGLLGR